MKKLLIAVLALALVAGIFLFKDYDSPELGASILGRLGEATGVEMAATGFRFNLMRGIELEGVTARSESDGRSFDLQLDSLRMEHRLMPLLSGTVAIETIVLEEPVFTLVETEGAGGEAEAEASGETSPDAGEEASEPGGGLTLEVRRIRVSDATLVMRDAAGTETRAEGLDLTMDDLSIDPSRSSLSGLAAEGELAIARAALDATTLTDLTSRFRLEDAVFDLESLTFRSEHGAFDARAKLDFNPVPFVYTMTAEVSPLDVNAMVGADDGLGAGSIQMDARGEGPEVRDVVADGTLALAEGQFPSVAIFDGIDQALGKNVLAGASYQATTAQIHLEDNVVRLMPFRLESPHARLDVEGTVDLTGPVALTLSVATPREGLNVAGAGGTVLDVLADDTGWVPIPMTVSGTLESPTVRPDARALSAQARAGARREAEEAVTGAAEGALRSLFGRRKKN